MTLDSPQPPKTFEKICIPEREPELLPFMNQFTSWLVNKRKYLSLFSVEWCNWKSMSRSQCNLILCFVEDVSYEG